MQLTWTSFVGWISRSFTRPEDTESIRIRKTCVVIVLLLLPFGNLAWAVSLFSLGLDLAAVINLINAVVVVVAVFGFLFQTQRFTLIFNLMLGWLFVYLFSLQTSLGGIVQSGLTFLGGLLIAMGSALILNRRRAIFWALVNVAANVIVLIIEPYVAASVPPDFPVEFSVGNGFFNVLWTTFLAMFLILYLVHELEIAQYLADTLLFNVLPRPIADRLKRNGETIAEYYESASVMFADIVGFTPLSMAAHPGDMVDLLSEIYSAFDRLVEQHGVEKIRTIGDSYMVAAGVPVPRPDHAQALADLALDMLVYCDELPPVGGHSIRFRIGINSGPLIAGVIGTARYQYDIWGDTVNTASRMESHGEPGKIQVSDATRRLLGADYAFEDRGLMEVKGKGAMRTWFLLDKAENPQLFVGRRF